MYRQTPGLSGVSNPLAPPGSIRSFPDTSVLGQREALVTRHPTVPCVPGVSKLTADPVSPSSAHAVQSQPLIPSQAPRRVLPQTLQSGEVYAPKPSEKGQRVERRSGCEVRTRRRRLPQQQGQHGPGGTRARERGSVSGWPWKQAAGTVVRAADPHRVLAWHWSARRDCLSPHSHPVTQGCLCFRFTGDGMSI